jgi:hypothetical protein
MIPKPPPGSIPGQVPSDVASMMEAGFAQSAQQQKTNIQYAPQSSNQQQGSQSFQHQQTPRDVGTLTEEATAVVTDVAEGVKNLVFDSVKDILGLKREPKTPEEQAKLQHFHQGWQRLSAEEQLVAQQRLQAEQQRKEMMAQEEEMKKQQEAEMKKQNEFVVPMGKVSGQAAVDKMNQDRKGMGGASG